MVNPGKIKLPLVAGDVQQSLLPAAPSLLSASMMAIAGMGDALLYAYLPVHGISMGLSLTGIGILLSVNKFSRFFFNRFVARTSKYAGIKPVFIAGIFVSGVSTMIYGWQLPFWILLSARIAWGFSFAALRFVVFQYAANSRKQDLSMGWTRGIQEAGPVLIYFAGPVLLSTLGAEKCFHLLSLLSFLLLLFLMWLPNVSMKEQQLNNFQLYIPGMQELWVFIAAFLLEGVLVVCISRLILSADTSNLNLLFITSVLVGCRRLLNLVMAPITGWLTTRKGFTRSFHISVILIMTGFILLASGAPGKGLIICFTGWAINSTLLPMMAFRNVDYEERLEKLTRISTGRDMGSATGMLVGLTLLQWLGPTGLPIAAFFILGIIWYYLFNFILSYE